MPAVPGPSRLIGDGNRSFARVGIGRWVDVRDRVRLFFLHLQHEERTRATGGPRKVSMLAHRGPTDIVVVEARMNGSYAGSQENSHAVRLRNHPTALHRSLPAPVFRGPCVFVALELLRVENPMPCSPTGVVWRDDACWCQLLPIALDFQWASGPQRSPHDATNLGGGTPDGQSIHEQWTAVPSEITLGPRVY
jgi:hypothetical protein